MTHKETGNLKAAVLDSVLTGKALPGSQQSVSMPDLHLVLNQPRLYILEKDMESEMHLSNLDKKVQLVNEEETNKLAQANGGIYYLQFAQESKEEGKLDLKLSVLHQTATGTPFPLSQIHLHFKKWGDVWLLSDQPAALSA